MLSILESDLMDVCLALVEGRLIPESVVFVPKATVCKYAVPVGYPDNPIKNVEIDISAIHNTFNLYLGAVNEVNGKLFATGSRTAAFVGVANTIAQAEQIAEVEVFSIKGPLFHRVHPSLLPAFAGKMDLSVHQAVLDSGMKKQAAPFFLCRVLCPYITEAR